MVSQNFVLKRPVNVLGSGKYEGERETYEIWNSLGKGVGRLSKLEYTIWRKPAMWSAIGLIIVILRRSVGSGRVFWKWNGVNYWDVGGIDTKWRYEGGEDCT